MNLPFKSCNSQPIVATLAFLITRQALRALPQAGWSAAKPERMVCFCWLNSPNKYKYRLRLTLLTRFFSNNTGQGHCQLHCHPEM